MHLQRFAPDQLVQQVAPFALQRISSFARTQTTTDRQTSLLDGSDRHVLGVLREAYPRVRCHRTPCLGGTLWVEEDCRGGQGLCVGLDVSLLEVVGVGLMTCEEVGVVKSVHLLSGEVRRIATALNVVEEVQEEVA